MRAVGDTCGALTQAVPLLLDYLAGAGWAWMHEGRKYHILAITLAVVSGVRGPALPRATQLRGCASLAAVPLFL